MNNKIGKNLTSSKFSRQFNIRLYGTVTELQVHLNITFNACRKQSKSASQ